MLEVFFVLVLPKWSICFFDFDISRQNLVSKVVVHIVCEMRSKGVVDEKLLELILLGAYQTS